jgi:hypothetical protein
MSAHEEERIQQLLKQALPPVGRDAEPGRGLWPVMLRRLDEGDRPAARSKWEWFDWVLAAGLAALAAVFPASIPLLLYCL